MISLKGYSFLKLLDFSPEQIRYLLDLSHKTKREKKLGIIKQRFIGKSIALIFEKRSTRTRCAFETAFGEEGGHPVFLSTDDIQLGGKESIEDTARVLGRMFDAIQFRGFSQKAVETLAAYSGVPVYNGLTDDFHPTQILADLMTIEEQFGTLKGIRVVYCGDSRNNVAHSLMIGCAKMGLHFCAAAPKSLFPDETLFATAQKIGKENGCTITAVEDPTLAVKNADVIYTDVWTSMGEEAKAVERERLLKPYQVNEKLFHSTEKATTRFMHCLPAVKGKEVTEEIIEGKNSVVWDEAENRKYTIKAVMLATLLNPDQI